MKKIHSRNYMYIYPKYILYTYICMPVYKYILAKKKKKTKCSSELF